MSETQAETAFCRFFYEPVIDREATRKSEEGLDIYKNELWSEIVQPGDKNSCKIGPATEDHKKRFARSLEAFKLSEEEPTEGTPLAMIALFGVDAIATLKAANIKTLEKFMSLTETELKQFGPKFKELHNKGAAYLEAAHSKGALASKFAKAEDAIESLTAELQEARAALEKAHNEIAELKGGKTGRKKLTVKAA